MNDRGSGPGELGFETFGAACGLAVVAGALATLVPSLDALTVALVALSVAGWASLHRRSAGPGRVLAGPLGTYLGPLLLLGAGATTFLCAPAPLVPWRGLVLGLSLVPLWAVERRHGVIRAYRRDG
jgi:hypothetical protein